MTQGKLKKSTRKDTQRKATAPPSGKAGIKKKSKKGGEQETMKARITKQCASAVGASIEAQMLDKLKKDGKPLYILGTKDGSTAQTQETKKLVQKKKKKK